MAKKLDEILDNSIVSGKKTTSKRGRPSSTKNKIESQKKASSKANKKVKNDILNLDVQPISEVIATSPYQKKTVQNLKLEPITSETTNLDIPEESVKASHSTKKIKTLHLNIDFGREIYAEEKTETKPQEIVKQPVSIKKEPVKIDTSVNQNSPFFYGPSVFEKFNLNILDINDESNFAAPSAPSANEETASLATTSEAENEAAPKLEIQNKASEKSKSEAEESIDKELYAQIVEKTASKKVTAGKQGSFINQNSHFFSEPSVFEKYNLKILRIDETNDFSEETLKANAAPTDNTIILNEILNIINSNKDADELPSNLDLSSKEISINNLNNLDSNNTARIYKIEDFMDNALSQSSDEANNISTSSNLSGSANKKEFKNVASSSKLSNSPIFKTFSFEDAKISPNFSLEGDSDLEPTSTISPVNNTSTVLKENLADIHTPITNIDNVVPEINILADNSSLPNPDVGSTNVIPTILNNSGNTQEFQDTIVVNTISNSFENDYIDELLEKDSKPNLDSESYAENTTKSEASNTNTPVDSNEEKTVESLLTEILTLNKSDIDEDLKNTLLTEISVAEEKLTDSLPPVKDLDNVENSTATLDFQEAIDYLTNAINKLEQLDDNDENSNDNNDSLDS